MKLLLLQPPIQDFYDTGIRLQPAGLCSLKAAVKKYLPQIEVLVRDYHHGRGRRTIPVPRELAYLKDFYEWPDESPFSTFYHYYHFGAGFEKIAEDTARERPDLVGISSLFSPYYREVLKTAEAVKKIFPVPVLAGGSHVSAAPLSVLADPNIDFIIRGEAERPLVEFLRRWPADPSWESVPNLGFKKNGRPVLNDLQDNFALEDLPAPDFSDFEPGRYSIRERPMSVVLTSRSCPLDCSFCSVHQTFGRHYRKRPIESILAEMTARYREGIRVFDFEDDNLLWDLSRAKELFREILRTFPDGDLELSAMNGVLYFRLDREILELMKAAGFRQLNISLVTGDRTSRRATGRDPSLEKYLEVVGLARRLDFQIVSYQILGLPHETLEMMADTLLLNARLPVLLGVSPFYLAPGSGIAKGLGELTGEELFCSRLSAMGRETAAFGHEDIYTLFITARILNFLKGLPVENTEVSFAEALGLARSRDTRSQTGADLLERLLADKKLYASTKDGPKPVGRFREKLFFRVWDRLGAIGTQNSGTIRLEN